MELAQGGAIDLWNAFPRMHDLETAFYLTDGSFRQLVQDLASASPPLAVAEVTHEPSHRLPKGSVSLTDLGTAVLRGAADRVRLCGLHRWLGGVLLEGSGAMWRWDPGAGRLVNA